LIWIVVEKRERNLCKVRDEECVQSFQEGVEEFFSVLPSRLLLDVSKIEERVALLLDLVCGIFLKSRRVRKISSGPYFKKLYAPGRNWTKPGRSVTIKETLLWRRLKFDGFQVLDDRLWYVRDWYAGEKNKMV
jgi:hypothetical protein